VCVASTCGGGAHRAPSASQHAGLPRLRRTRPVTASTSVGTPGLRVRGGTGL
jgi:hypothetical protein